MRVEIKIIEEYTDEEKFAERVAKTMEIMNTNRVKYSVVAGEGSRGFLYSAMIIKIKR